MSKHKFEPGEPTEGLTAERYNEMVDTIEARKRIGIAAPLERYGTSPDVIGIAWPEGFYAKLSGSTSPYSFTEQYGAASGAWANMVRTGTTNAYEVNGVASLNNKVVWVEPGYPGEYLFQYVGSAGSCATATVNAGPITCDGTLTGVTWDLRDAADTTTLATQTGSTASFTGVAGGTGYKVRATKASYHTKTSATVTAGCGATVTASVTTWQTSYDVLFTVNRLKLPSGGLCPAENVTVAVTGDGTGSGTTNSSGQVTISVSSTSANNPQNVTVTMAPPSGTGTAVLTYSVALNACGTSTQTKTLAPSSGHRSIICNNKYMPDSLTWTDDYGSCTMSPSGTGWAGSYTYTSSHAINEYACGAPPIALAYPEQSGDVTVNVYIPEPTISSCTSTTFVARRAVWVGENVECGSATTRCQPVADYYVYGPGSASDVPTLAEVLSDSPGVSASCGTSISLALSVPAASASACATYEETAVSVTVTGTIT